MAESAETGAIAYRLATLEDIGTLAALRWESEVERHTPAVSREDFIAAYLRDMRPAMAAGAHQVWLAEADGEPIACALLAIWATPPNAHHLHRPRGFVSSVYTRPAYRRRGIARHLMRELIAFARERGIQRLILWASEMGAPLYAELGFVPSRALELDLF